MRTKSTENHAYDPHVLIELVPDDPADYHCGAQTITVADFTPHGSERAGRRQGAGRREEVDPDGARRVEERQLHGVRGRGDPGAHHVVHRGQGGRDRQEPGGGLRRPDDAAALAGRTGLDEINRTQAISDWQRGYSLDRGAQKTDGAPLQQGTHAGGC